MTIINVTKRNGQVEPLNLEKIHKVLGWACDNITGVSVSEIAMKSQIKFYDGMQTAQIHETLIKTAAELISEEFPNYQYVAGNLLNYDLRKVSWGGITQPRLYDHVVKMVNDGFYTAELLEFYTEADYDAMDGFLDHDRDFNMTYIGLNEYITKYSVRDRSLSSLSPLETPQITYILVAALSCLDTKKIKDIKSMYNDFSLWNISLPTPIMAGLRSPIKQFSSCVLISSGDTIDSLTEASAAIVKYASKKAGIGIDASRIRAEGDPVGKGNSTKHTGAIPFIRMFEGALKSSAQGSIRGASATTYISLWHLEIADLLVLKNNKGTPDSRVRKLDYGIQINNYLYNRFINGEDITLFSPSYRETPGLYDAFFADQKEFARLYEKYEKDPKIRKKSISSAELFASLVTERKETGRIYIFNVDNVNDNSCFLDSITTSNLCLTGDTRISTDKGLHTLKYLYDNNIEFSVASDVRAFEGSEVLQPARISGKFKGVLGVEVKPASNVVLTNEYADTITVTLANGQAVSCTTDHKIMTNVGFIAAGALTVGDLVYIQSGEGASNDALLLPAIDYPMMKNCKDSIYKHNLPTTWDSDIGFVLGWLIGDGFIYDNSACFVVGKYDEEVESRLTQILNKWLPNHTIGAQQFDGSKQIKIQSMHFSKFLHGLGITEAKSHVKQIPESIWTAPKSAQIEFLRALFGADGTVDISKKCSARTISLTSTSNELLSGVQLLLSNYGINSSIYNGRLAGTAMLPDSNRVYKEYPTKQLYVLKIGKSNRNKFIDTIGFCIERKHETSVNYAPGPRGNTYSERFMVKVASISYNGIEPVYDIAVDGSHSFIANGIVVHNCAEITLPTVPMASIVRNVINEVPMTKLAEVLLVLQNDIFVDSYKISNPRLDIVVPTVDVNVTRDNSLVALCTLSAINLGNVKNFDDLENVCRNAVKSLDNLLDYQDYMVPAAKRHTHLYRPLGIGITNLAYYLAKNNFKYSDSGALELMHETMEAIQYYCIKASIELAKERGPCAGYEKTTWAQGILPIDRYNKHVDELVPHVLKLDWEWLRAQLKLYGIRNATLTAMMPAESSSRIFNSTNGVEPVRALITTKSNKEHVTKQVVPEFNRLKNRYHLLWDMENMTGVIHMMAVLQKFTCQSISTNTSYNPAHFPNGEIPMSLMLGDMLMANYYGVKTLYYNNLRDGAEDSMVEDATPQEMLQLTPEVEERCDACSI